MEMPSKREKLVVSGREPVRLDRFLADHFEGISRAYLQELIAQGLVTVNAKRPRKGTVVSKGDRVDVEPFPRPEERRIAPNPKVRFTVLWESEDLVVIDKPAGLPTHPNDFSDRETLANAVLAKYPEIQGVGEDSLRPGIVHRLDTDTSGLMVVARTQAGFDHLRRLFDERKVRKTYLALVLGDVAEAGEVETPMAHHPKNPRKMVVVTPEVERKGAFRSKIREAKTMYEPVERFGAYTLLEVKTLTGRMHQVRVHLGSIGHPLAGDRLYQTAKQRQEDQLPLDRHFLHSCKLSLSVYPSKSLKSFESELPIELRGVLEELRASA